VTFVAPRVPAAAATVTARPLPLPLPVPGWGMGCHDLPDHPPARGPRSPSTASRSLSRRCERSAGPRTC